MERTRRELTGHARRLTVERGLHGFTVEELCEIVGVSRRTFFNYFAAKEDAVLGHRDDGIPAEHLTTFINARPAGSTGISPSLIDDLIAMVIVSLEELAADGQGLTTPEAVIAREPQLLGKFLREGAEMERVLAGVICTREGLPEGDPIAEMAVGVVGVMVRRAAGLYFRPENTASFASHLLASADATKTLFAATLSA
jgi:AcrR family transcriptional regulator